MEINAYRISIGTLVAIAVAAATSALLAVVLRRRMQLPVARCVWIGLAVASAVAVLLITLWPGRHLRGPFRCEFSGSVFDWVHGNQSTANVAMLVPVSVALPLAVRGTRWSRWALVGLVALPVAIEAAQRLLPVGRACDGMDVVDNWLGVAAGCCIGWIGARVASRAARRWRAADR